PDVWEMLAPVMDAAMVDLKCLDPQIHLQLTGQPNERVLASIRHLHDLGRLYEVRLLILPGLNDGDALLERTAAWLADIDPHMRLKVIGLRRHGVRPSPVTLREPAAGERSHYRDVVAQVGDFAITVV
ncbi:MAG TPA: hypothetical protein VHM65_09000, partial [Candidatus Lustribacter sp.]|nr:hypothetical protein [Candidatus Lustribacter sp.]